MYEIDFRFCPLRPKYRFKDELLLIVFFSIEPYFSGNVVCLKSGGYPGQVRL